MYVLGDGVFPVLPETRATRLENNREQAMIRRISSLDDNQSNDLKLIWYQQVNIRRHVLR